jgi:Flp pilus assembly protein CpaB
MKQKNMIMIGVAVGFGLLAALLATQMNAKPQGDQVFEQEMPVPAIEIPINTKLTKDEINTYITWKKFKKEAIPPGEWAMTIDELVDKRMIRTYRQDELINRKDLSNKPLIEIPAGYNMITFGINREKIVGGFAVPGSKVDVLATTRLTKINQAITFPLFRDMLILAVDTKVTPNQDQTANAAVSDVSMAVTPNQALILHAAIGRGSDLRLLLVGQNKTDKRPTYTWVPTDDEIQAILQDTYDPRRSKGSEETGEPKKEFETVELPVPKEDLPAGTEITKELIENKFTVLPIKPPAPDSFVKDIREQTGKFLTKDLAANLFVPQSFLGEKPKPPVAEVKGPPPVYWDVTVQTPTGVRKFRYEMKNGKYQYKGEIKPEEEGTHDGSKAKLGDTEPKADDNKKPAERVIRD